MEIEVSDQLSEAASAFVQSEWAQMAGAESGMATPRGIAITVTDDGQIVAALKAWCAGGVSYLTELMVASGRRSGGLGSEVLRRYEDRCAELDCRRLALRTEQGGDAQRFYERHGWFVEQTVDDWIDGHTYVQMRKDVTN